MAYMKDYRHTNKLDDFDPIRDVPGIVAAWDFSDLQDTLANGADIEGIEDRGPNGLHLFAPTAARRPTLVHAAQGGLSAADFTTTAPAVLARQSSSWQQASSTGIAQPFTIFLVAKFRAGSTATARIALGASGVTVGAQATTPFPIINAGSNGVGSSPLNDDTWHVLAYTISATTLANWIDGILDGSNSGTSPAGSNNLNVLALALGARASTWDLPFDGLIGEAFIVDRLLPARRIADISEALGRKWGITTRKHVAGGGWLATTSSNGQSIRVFAPPGGASLAGAPRVLWAHNYTGTEAVTPAFVAYVLAHAITSMGGIFAASAQHGDQWGNSTAIADMVDLDTYLTSRYGTAGKRILAGASMGGLTVANMVAKGSLSNIVAALCFDPVLDLSSVYGQASPSYTSAVATAYALTSGTLSGSTSSGVTSLPTTASFPTIGTILRVGAGTANYETVTTTGASSGTAVAVTATTKAHASGEVISDFGTKAATYDPMVNAGSAYSGPAWWLAASSADTNIPRANHTVPFVTKIGSAPPEVVTFDHGGGHMSTPSYRPTALVPFLERALAR